MGALKSMLGTMFSAPKKRLQGRVKWFDKEKGFGKILPLAGQDRPQDEVLFVHKNELEGGVEGKTWQAIGQGVLVSFELAKGSDKKVCAGKVRCEGLAMAVASVAAATATTLSSVEDELVHRFVVSGLRWGTSQVKGHAKASMEDRYAERAGVALSNVATGKAACAFFGVFDGHGGVSCSDFVANQLDRSFFDSLREQSSQKKKISTEAAIRSALLSSFRITDHNFLQYANKLDGGAARAWATSGSTACAAAIFGPDEEGRLRLHIAHAGNCRAVLVKQDGKVVRLTEEHKPNVPAEKKRIEAAGGAVAQIGGAWRVVLGSKSARGHAAGVSISRGFGDADFKAPAEVVSPVPDVHTVVLDRTQDAFLLLGTDGVFGALTDLESARLVGTSLRDAGGIGVEPAEVAAKRLIEAAHERRASDDKTALVVVFSDLLPSAFAGPRQILGGISDGQLFADTHEVNGTPAAGAAELPAQPAVAPSDIFEDGTDPTELALLDDIFSSYAKDLGVGDADAKQPAPVDTLVKGKPANTAREAGLPLKKKPLSAKTAKKIF